jgi:D-glycero-D-manno-heptose 1,7-bisphosphate phosphatase
MKAIFLDKDATLVDEPPCNVEARRIHLVPGAGAALRLLACLDYRFFVVSNADGIALGHCTEGAMDGVGKRLADLLFREQVNLDGFYYCPHHPDGLAGPFACACTCRRPQPGLLLQAAREHEIDLRASWMVGAILHDVEAGTRAGCRTALVDTGNETQWRLGQRRVPTLLAQDLHAAAVLIANADGAWR